MADEPWQKSHWTPMMSQIPNFVSFTFLIYFLISWKFSGFAQFCPSFPRVFGPHLIKLASLCACCCTLGQQQDPNSHGPLSAVVVGAWHMEGWEKRRKKG